MEKELTLQEAKDLLITFNRWWMGENIEQPDGNDVEKAIDIAIQCLEDSIQNNEDATFDNY